MTRTRLEAFSDGVLAILVTIMVLELHAPHEASLEALTGMLPKLLSYLLSFVFIAIYWNNHHHMIHMVDRVNGKILWANLHLLFWLSLVSFTTAWAGEHPADTVPTALYGIVFLCSGLAWLILQTAIIRHQGPGSKLAAAVGNDWKGKLSSVILGLGILFSFVRPWIAQLFYVVVALVWLVPDRRIEAHHAQAQQ